MLLCERREADLPGVERLLVRILPGIAARRKVPAGATTEAIRNAFNLRREVLEVVHARVGRVSLLDLGDGDGPHQPHSEAHEEVGDGGPQVARADLTALVVVELFILDVPLLRASMHVVKSSVVNTVSGES